MIINVKKQTKHPKKKRVAIKGVASQEIRYFNTILESVDSKFDLIAEQYGTITQDISQIKNTLSSHTEMIGKLAVDVEIIKTDISFIKTGLKRKVDIEEFVALENRVALLEQQRH